MNLYFLIISVLDILKHFNQTSHMMDYHRENIEMYATGEKILQLLPPEYKALSLADLNNNVFNKLNKLGLIRYIYTTAGNFIFLSEIGKKIANDPAIMNMAKRISVRLIIENQMETITLKIVDIKILFYILKLALNPFCTIVECYEKLPSYVTKEIITRNLNYSDWMLKWALSEKFIWEEEIKSEIKNICSRLIKTGLIIEVNYGYQWTEKAFNFINSMPALLHQAIISNKEFTIELSETILNIPTYSFTNTNTQLPQQLLLDYFEMLDGVPSFTYIKPLSTASSTASSAAQVLPQTFTISNANANNLVPAMKRIIYRRNKKEIELFDFEIASAIAEGHHYLEDLNRYMYNKKNHDESNQHAKINKQKFAEFKKQNTAFIELIQATCYRLRDDKRVTYKQKYLTNEERGDKRNSPYAWFTLTESGRTWLDQITKKHEKQSQTQTKNSYPPAQKNPEVIVIEDDDNMEMLVPSLSGNVSVVNSKLVNYEIDNNIDNNVTNDHEQFNAALAELENDLRLDPLKPLALVTDPILSLPTKTTAYDEQSDEDILNQYLQENIAHYSDFAGLLFSQENLKDNNSLRRINMIPNATGDETKVTEELNSHSTPFSPHSPPSPH